jgi:hypothetical protein
VADDITLTVRVRDLTRGEFNQLRQRLRGMDQDMRRITGSTNNASQSADRFANSIRGVQGRLGQLQRTGSLARSEMDFMRRSMSLLGRDLRLAARNGELTGDEFRTLRNELERTRLDFDHLANSVRRHSAVTDRAAREAQQRQQAQQRMGRIQAQAQRENEARILRLGRLQARAQREDDQRTAAAQRNLQRMGQLQARALREDAQRIQQLGQIQARAQRMDEERLLRMGRLQAQAQRMDAQRTQRAEAERQRAVRAAAADQQRDMQRLAGLGGNDAGLAVRFRTLGTSDMARMTRGFGRLRHAIAGVTVSSAQAQRSVRVLGNDLRVMSQALQDAQTSGNLTRREFNALANGIDLVDRNASALRSSGDMTRSSFREMRREIDLLRTQLRFLDNEGSVFQRLSDRMILVSHRLRESNSHAGFLRRNLGRIGDFGARGASRAIIAFGSLTSGLKKAADWFSGLSRGMKLFVVGLALLGPVAQAAGALLTTALGGAFIALGAFALRGSESVKKAFSDMRASISADLRDAAKPMEGFLLNGMAQVAKAFNGLRPLLQQAFAAAGPLIEDFFGAFTDLAQKAMPGIASALESMGPVIEGFRAAMAEVGEGIGEMFDAMTSNGGAEALREVWATLGRELKNLLVGIGEFINFASKSESVTALMVTAFRTLSGILNVVQAGLSILDGLFGWFIQDVSLSANALALLGENAQAAGSAMVPAGQSVEALRSQLSDLDTEIARIKKAQEDLDSGVTGRARDYALKGDNATDEDLAAAQQKRKDLLLAIGVAEAEAAAAARDHASAVQSLTQQIRDLNAENLKRFNAQAAMEQSIDDAKKKADEFTGKIKIQNGMFDLNHEASRQVYEALAKVAENTAAAAAQAEESHAPLSEINELWGRGREQLMSLGTAFGVPKEQLSQFIDLVLQTPESATTRLRVEKEQADAAVNAAIAKIKSVPPEEKSQITVEAFRAMERASTVQSLLNAIDGRVATSTIITQYRITGNPNIPSGTYYGSTAGRSADGNIYGGRSYANGGMEQHVAQIAQPTFRMWAEPETGGEAYIPLSPAKRPRSTAILSDVANQFGYRLESFASGGLTQSQVKKLGAPGDLSSLRSVIAEIRSWIKGKTSGGTESRLLNTLDQVSKKLIAQQAALGAVNKSLTRAKEKLDDLKQAAASLKESVRSGVLSSTDITRAASGDGRVTLAKVMNTMRQGRDKSVAFAGALKSLQDKGVSKYIIQQIAQAGIDGGGLETATAILGASSSDVATLNSMQTEINSAAKSAGITASNAMYSAGIKAAEGLVKGLTNQKKNIEAAMMKIAKSMETAIKKALGIKSPSKVMEEVGRFTAEGFAVGMTKNRSVDTAWTSMLNTGPAPAGGNGDGGGAGGQYVIPIYIGNKMLDEIILDSNRRTVRTRGGNVQSVYGR